MDALHHPGQTLQAPLGRGIVIAGVDQVKAVDPARIFGGPGLVQKEPRIAPVGGGSGQALQHHLGLPHRGIPAAGLGDPAAVEGAHTVFSGQIHHIAHALAQLHWGIPGVFHHAAAGEGGVIGGVVHGQPQAPLGKGQLQALFGAMACGEGTLHGRCFYNFRAGKPQIRGASQKLQGAFPVVPPPAAAPFQRQRIQTACGVVLVQQHAGTPAQTRTQTEGVRIGSLHRGTEVQMLRDAVWVDFYEIGIGFRVKMKYAVFFQNHTAVLRILMV